MRRSIRCLVALVVLVGVAVCAAAQPVIVQPSNAGLSATELAAFEEAYRELTGLLRNHESGSQKLLGQDGWGALDFAAFTAGSLARHGYETALVEQASDAGTVRVWVLVALDLGTRAVWIPVEPLPNPAAGQKTLGAVAGEESTGALVRLDASYVSYDRVLELSSNVAPIASIRPPAHDIAEQEASAWFGNTSLDPDGTIVLYQWAFDDEMQRVTSHIAQWYTFRSSGTYTVSLTVTDNRGAQASTSLSLYVLTTEEAEADCGCGG